MTSRHCFSKILIEDFRHKIWMLALSIIGNLLAFPIAFLLTSSASVSHSMNIYDQMMQSSTNLVEYYQEVAAVTAGIIALAGAVIVGLAGFRYVYHRNMIDTYHSIPVKRKTLFLATWLNGFLIWFVPFAGSIIVTLLMGLSKAASIKRAFAMLTGLDSEELALVRGVTTELNGKILSGTFQTALAVTIGFFLIYHLVLLAVMLCGNVLNTLVVGGVIGTGAVGLYGLVLILENIYFDTFLEMIAGLERVVLASPFVSAIYQIYRCVRNLRLGGESYAISYGMLMLINLFVAVLLFVLTYVAYMKRPSELAEQGFKYSPLTRIIQGIVVLAGGIGGWLMFSVVAAGMFGADGKVAWGVFGAVFVGVMACGVLDIIFQMDFRAFFAHKLFMLCSVAAAVVLSLSFCLDWYGYDTYLPSKEQIASIGVYSYNQTNQDGYYGRYSWNDSRHPLQKVNITDVDAAYAFLERGVQRQTDNHRLETEDEKEYLDMTQLYVRVTLKNHKSYYKCYLFARNDAEVLLDIFGNESYLDQAYCMDTDFDQVYSLYLGRSDIGMNITEEAILGGSFPRELAAAYNQDIYENSKQFLKSDGRMLCMAQMRMNQAYNSMRSLEIYDFMTNSIACLKKYGYGDYVKILDASEIAEIRIPLPYWYSNMKEHPSFVEMAAEAFGVSLEGESKEKYVDSYEAKAEMMMVMDEFNYYDRFSDVAVVITDPLEIAELVELMSYQSPYHASTFFKNYRTSDFVYIDLEGKEHPGLIDSGKMPLKYLLRFADLQEEFEEKYTE